MAATRRTMKRGMSFIGGSFFVGIGCYSCAVDQGQAGLKADPVSVVVLVPRTV